MSNHKLVSGGSPGQEGGRSRKRLSCFRDKGFLARVLAFALAAGMLAATGLAALPSTTEQSVEVVGEGP